MKLRNKKTGEIGNLLPWVDYKTKKEMSHFAVMLDNRSKEPLSYNSLAELNEEWEDYEEPETYYYISDCTNIESLTNDHGYNLSEEIWHKAIERRKEIGNYFETREEAEKAVEKLKAWKRLKDKGFRFTGFSGGRTIIEFTFDNYCSGEPSSAFDDLDLLFGGDDE